LFFVCAGHVGEPAMIRVEGGDRFDEIIDECVLP